MSDTYQILKNEGYDFPPVDNVGAAIMETEAVSYSTDHYIRREPLGSLSAFNTDCS